jgi:hypothetical protein
VSLNHAIAFLSGKRRIHRRAISLKTLSKLVKLSDGTSLSLRQPVGGRFSVSLSQHFDECRLNGDFSDGNGKSCSMNDPQAEQIKLGPTIHFALDQF